MKQRIQKLLAHAGVASRRKIEEMIREGRVAVNNQITTDLPILIDPQKDSVIVDGETIKLRANKHEDRDRIYILMYKPKNVYSTNVAQGEQRRVIDLLPPEFARRVYPVGQLEAMAKGLVLLTNDGELTNRLTHPRYGVPKVYRAVVDGLVGAGTLTALQRDASRSGSCQIRVAHSGREKSVVDITLREGRNPRVREMLADAGHKVRDLTRVRIGPLTLKGLAMGESRMLDRGEVRQLYKATEKVTPRPTPKPGDAKIPPRRERINRPARRFAVE